MATSPISRDAQGELQRYGRLAGLAGLPASIGLEFLPFGLLRGRDRRAPASLGLPTGRDLSVDVGLDAQVRLTPGLTLNATVLPDFGQVEADRVILNLSTFELFYPEKRPFFLESADLFIVPDVYGEPLGAQLFYSRRIGAALSGALVPAGASLVDTPERARLFGALKLSGKIGDRVSLALLDGLPASEQETLSLGAGTPATEGLVPLANTVAGRIVVSAGAGLTSTEVGVELFGRNSWDAVKLSRGVQINHRATWSNSWRSWLELQRYPSVDDNRETRDGSITQRTEQYGIEISVGTNPSAPVVFSFDSLARTTWRGFSLEVSPTLAARPLDSLELSLGGTFDRVTGDPRWVDTLAGAGGERTYRFGLQDALAPSGILRATYTLTTHLTLQAYAQLFFASVRYGQLYEVPKGPGRARVSLGDLVPSGVDSSAYQERDAVLNFSLVLRWEFRPCSVLYVVYNRGHQGGLAPGTDDAGRPIGRARLDFASLGRGPIEDALLVKASWFLSHGPATDEPRRACGERLRPAGEGTQAAGGVGSAASSLHDLQLAERGPWHQRLRERRDPLLHRDGDDGDHARHQERDGDVALAHLLHLVEPRREPIEEAQRQPGRQQRERHHQHDPAERVARQLRQREVLPAGKEERAGQEDHAAHGREHDRRGADRHRHQHDGGGGVARLHLLVAVEPHHQPAEQPVAQRQHQHHHRDGGDQLSHSQQHVDHGGLRSRVDLGCEKGKVAQSGSTPNFPPALR